MKNIVLIGMMGCGKSTVGQLLSQQLQWEWIDTDQMIIQKEGRSIADIFDCDGETYFRNLELETCRELAQEQNLVIACGGGLPLQEACVQSLKQNGVIFWLDRDPAETYDSMDLSARPLAQQGREAFLERYRQRAPLYKKASDFVVSHTKDAQDAAHRVANILKSQEVLR